MKIEFLGESLKKDILLMLESANVNLNVNSDFYLDF